MTRTIQVAIGPKLPEFGSWNWLGEGLSTNLSHPFVVEQFVDVASPPSADVLVFIKFLPSLEQLERMSGHCKIVFLPVDVYGSCREIDNSYRSLRCTSQILVNSQRLLRYFRGYSEVAYVDHPLKFVLPNPRLTTDDGPIVWIGQVCNIGPAVQWINAQSTDRELWILTNCGETMTSAKTLGIEGTKIRVDRWSETKHLEYLGVASTAIDIKGNDFRARHKPPAKALDFLASGIPVITNRGSSVDFHVRHLGLTPLYADSWRSNLTAEYRNEIFNDSRCLRAQLNSDSVWDRFRSIFQRLTL